MNFLEGYSAKAQPNQSHYWFGTHNLAGGRSGQYSSAYQRDYLEGDAGQTGVVSSGKCFGGYSGPFCAACPAGTFKYDYSYAPCKPCENKPENSYYKGIAQATSNCAYECSAGLDPVEVNPYCKNALKL